MNPFRYERARDATSAIALLAQAPNGVFLAGGTNLVDHLKLGVRQADLLIMRPASASATCRSPWISCCRETVAAKNGSTVSHGRPLVRPSQASQMLGTIRYEGLELRSALAARAGQPGTRPPGHAAAVADAEPSADHPAYSGYCRGVV